MKTHHQLFNNLSIELTSSSEIDSIIQKGEVIFKKNRTIGLPEVSRLINSAISKRQGDQKKHSFLEKKTTALKGKWIHYEHPEISHHLMGHAIKQSTHQSDKIFFHISKCWACNTEKTLKLKITNKK